MEWSEHFYPRMDFDNAIGEVGTEGGEQEFQLCKERNHVRLKQMYAGSFRTQLDVRAFPFDAQWLTITIKSRTVSDGNFWATPPSCEHMVELEHKVRAAFVRVSCEFFSVLYLSVAHSFL